MRKSLYIFLFALIFSMGFLFRIKVDPEREEFLKLAHSYFYRKYYPLCDFKSFYNIMLDKKAIVKSISFYPWSIKISWEDEYTWILIKNRDKEERINQIGKTMNYLKKSDTIVVKNFQNIPKEEIIKLVKNISKEFKIEEISLCKDFFEIKNNKGRILMDYKNYKDQLKYIKILKNIVEKDYLFDLRFKIVSIKE